MKKGASEDSKQINNWIDLSENDLQCARILYFANQYRNSYFFFQQAVEKGNKALAAYLGYSENRIRDNVGHDSLKIYENYIDDEVLKTEETIKRLSGHPLIQEGSSMNLIDLPKHRDKLKSSNKIFKEIRDENLFEIHGDILDNLLDSLEDVEAAEIQLPKPDSPEFNQIISDTSDILEYIENKPEEFTHEQFNNIINQEYGRDFLYCMVKEQLKISHIMAFVGQTFLISAAFTHNHNVRARYPYMGATPLNLYSRKRAIIKKQNELMDIFERALAAFRKMANAKPAKFTLPQKFLD